MNPLKKSKTNFKRSVSRAAGIPTTKSGRSRKAKSMEAQGLFWLIIIGLIIYVIMGGDGG